MKKSKEFYQYQIPPDELSKLQLDGDPIPYCTKGSSKTSKKNDQVSSSAKKSNASTALDTTSPQQQSSERSYTPSPDQIRKDLREAMEEINQLRIKDGLPPVKTT
jgi:uncharacterized protein YkwD